MKISLSIITICYVQLASSYVKKSFLVSAWTFGCKVNVKPPTGNPTVITSLADLVSIIHVISPGENVQFVTCTGASASC